MTQQELRIIKDQFRDAIFQLAGGRKNLSGYGVGLSYGNDKHHVLRLIFKDENSKAAFQQTLEELAPEHPLRACPLPLEITVGTFSAH